MTINPDICWLIGADMSYGTIKCDTLSEKKDDKMIVMIKSYYTKSGK